jgi:hypothetical protein
MFLAEIRTERLPNKKLQYCRYTILLDLMKVKGKAIPLTGRGGPYGCQTSWLPYFLDSRLSDGGEVYSRTRRPPLTPKMIPGAHFC